MYGIHILACFTVVHRIHYFNTLLWDGIVISLVELYHLFSLRLRPVPSKIKSVCVVWNVHDLRSELYEQASSKRLGEVVHNISSVL